MSLTFIKQDPAVTIDGDVGGDAQATDSYSVRYLATEQVDGHYALVTEYHYGAQDSVMDAPEQTEARAAAEGTRPFFVSIQREFMICTDPADPGSTEVWSDYTYSDGPERFATLAEVFAAAHASAAASTPEGFTWDGAMHIERHPVR